MTVFVLVSQDFSSKAIIIRGVVGVKEFADEWRKRFVAHQGPVKTSMPMVLDYTLNDLTEFEMQSFINREQRTK